MVRSIDGRRSTKQAAQCFLMTELPELVLYSFPYDDHELLPSCDFLQRAQNVHCIELQGPTGGEQFQVALPFEASLDYCTIKAVTDCLVSFVVYTWPVEQAFYSLYM